MISRAGVASLGAAIVLALGAGAASASSLVYRCGASFENLCRANADGSGVSQLTMDGDPNGAYYHSPSLSRDGTHLAFLLGASLYTSDANAQNRSALISGSAFEAHMAPDGTRVMAMRYGDASPSTVATILTWAVGGGDQHLERYGSYFASWAGSGELASGEGSGIQGRDAKSVCLLTGGDARPRTCDRTVASDPARNLYGGELSPDGKLLAVRAVDSGGNSSIALFDFATGAFVRDLTTGPSDRYPTWSPDGQFVAFQRVDAIYRVPASGGPGSETQIIASGREPTWGGPADSGPVPVPPGGGSNGNGTGTGGGPGSAVGPNPKVKAARKQHMRRLSITVSCSAACKFTTRGSKLLAPRAMKLKTVTRKLPAGKHRKLSLKLSKKQLAAARRTLKKHRVPRVKLLLTSYYADGRIGGPITRTIKLKR